MESLLLTLLMVITGTQAALEAIFEIFFAEQSRWVPALPYRRKPTWYGKKRSG
jgi:hypothetical protein